MKPFLFLLYCLAICADALSPEQERSSFRLADDSLRVELVASEPNVISPVAIAWDSKGRMFAAEMIDYPVGPGSGVFVTGGHSRLSQRDVSLYPIRNGPSLSIK